MSKWTVFCLRACVLAAVSLVFTVGSSSAEGRLLRLVGGHLVEIDRSDPSFTGRAIGTMSGDEVEIDPYGSQATRADHIEAIAEAVGGWDQLDLLAGKYLEGEGPGGTDIFYKYGGRLSQMGYRFYRVVDGALIVPKPLTPHTGYFVSVGGTSVEIDPDRSVREQYDEIEALIASGAPIVHPGGRLLRLVDGQFGGIRSRFGDSPFTGHFVYTMSGDNVEVDRNVSEADYAAQLEAIAEALGGWDQLNYFGRKVLEGEGPGGTDIYHRYGGNLAKMGNKFYRVVDGALSVPNPLIPHTGHFVYITSESIWVEIDPDRPVREQHDEIDALIALGANISGILRLVGGQFVEIDRSDPSFTGHAIDTMSGDVVEVDLYVSEADRADHLEAIAEAVGGWDQLDYLGRKILEGEDSGGEDIELRYGGDLSQMGGEFYRVVDGALIVPDPLTPHTGHFVYIPSESIYVEIAPDRPVREQYDAIEALRASVVPIMHPEGRLFRLWVWDGELVEIDRSNPSFTGHTIGTMSGDEVEVNPGASDESRFYHLQAIAKALGGWDQLDYLGRRFIEGEDSGDRDIVLRYGGDLSQMGGYFYRVVGRAVIVPDPLTPHTGYFIWRAGFWTEIDPDRPVQEQYEEIQALIDSGGALVRPGKRLLRLVDGQLVEIGRDDPPFMGDAVLTTSGDVVEFDPDTNQYANGFEQYRAIAEAVGGWDQIFRAIKATLNGEGPGGTDIRIRLGGYISPTHGTFYRVVDGALTVLDTLTPHTGVFVYIPSRSVWVEIDWFVTDPDRSVREQYDAIEALIASGAPIETPAEYRRLLRLVDGQLVEILRSDPSFTGREIKTMSGDGVEFPRYKKEFGDWRQFKFDQLKPIAEAVGGWDQIDDFVIRDLDGEGPDGQDIRVRYGGDIAPIGGKFHRVVDGALIVPNPLTPDTGVFMFMLPKVGLRLHLNVEIDPDRPVREQYDEIEALIASGAHISYIFYLSPLDGQLVYGLGPSSFTTIHTMSGHAVRIDPDADGYDQLKAVVKGLGTKGLGGWDQLDYLGRKFLEGEGSGGGDIELRYGGKLSQMGGEFYRVVDGALIVPDPPTPHTGHFVFITSESINVEIDSGRPVREQYDEIEALIASGAPIMRPTTALEAGSVASLGAPAPNPGNPTLTLSYAIGQSESLPVSLKVYNIVGQVVRALVNDVQGVGSYRAVWDGLNDSGNAVASGTYIAVLTVGDFRASKKLTLAK